MKRVSKAIRSLQPILDLKQRLRDSYRSVGDFCTKTAMFLVTTIWCGGNNEPLQHGIAARTMI